MENGFVGAAPRTSSRPRNPLLGTYCLVFSQAIMFLGFCSVFLFFQLEGRGWPPPGSPRLSLVLPTINMLVLLASSATMRWAGRSLRRDRLHITKVALFVTMLLGGLFLADQMYSFFRIGLPTGSSLYIAILYILIAMHAIHTVGGLIFLGINLNRTQAGDFTPVRHVGFDAGEIFWHFVVWIWAVLFVLLFLI